MSRKVSAKFGEVLWCPGTVLACLLWGCCIVKRSTGARPPAAEALQWLLQERLRSVLAEPTASLENSTRAERAVLTRAVRNPRWRTSGPSSSSATTSSTAHNPRRSKTARRPPHARGVWSRSSVRALAGRLAAGGARRHVAASGRRSRRRPPPHRLVAARAHTPPGPASPASSTADRTGLRGGRPAPDSRARRERRREEQAPRADGRASHQRARGALARGAVGAAVRSARQRAGSRRRGRARGARARQAEAKAKRAPEINEVSAQLAGSAPASGLRLYEEGKEAAAAMGTRAARAPRDAPRGVRRRRGSPRRSTAATRPCRSGCTRRPRCATRRSSRRVAHQEAEAAAAGDRWSRRRRGGSPSARRAAARSRAARDRGSPADASSRLQDVLECVHAPASTRSTSS